MNGEPILEQAARFMKFYYSPMGQSREKSQESRGGHSSSLDGGQSRIYETR